MPLRDKILDRSKLKDLSSKWRADGLILGFTNGCFDILHRGHVEYLEQAASRVDRLIVGLNSDASTRRLKGDKRPINDETSRAIVLAGLVVVDIVVLFDEDTPYQLITEALPQVLMKGGDYNAENVVGGDVVRQVGGKVEIIPLLEGYSTTLIANKIRSL